MDRVDFCAHENAKPKLVCQYIYAVLNNAQVLQFKFKAFNEHTLMVSVSAIRSYVIPVASGSFRIIA